MTWITSIVAVLALLMAGPALAEQGAATSRAAVEVRHSGSILEVAPDASSIVMEELVAWTGPGTGVVTRSLRITPRTSIRLLKRTDRWDGTAASMPGWDSTMVKAAMLRPGDFVTVTTDDDARNVAVALQVVRAGS